MKRWLRENARVAVAGVLTLVLVAATLLVTGALNYTSRTTVVGYFDNSTGLFAGDDVRIRGVSVGKVEKIEPQPLRSKITFWFDRKYKAPATAMAVILSPQLVTGRAIQLTPPYSGGPSLADGAVIPQNRTAVPVEWDDVRAQLERLTDMLQPTTPGGVSTLGALVNTAADNLRGQGPTIRDSVLKLSQTVSALGDHSKDIFGSVRNLSTLLAALRDSSGLLSQLNGNLAAVSSLLADDPNKVSKAIEDLNTVLPDAQRFIADNSEAIGNTSDKLTSISNAAVASLDDVKQTLHELPTVMADFNNIYEPANGSLTGELMINDFANPVSFLCGAIQAASRLGADQSSKLCMQYLSPILKNRQYNFLPLGEDLFVGAQARPNEVTYSQDWMRPDFVPPAPNSPQAAAAPSPPPAQAAAPAPAPAPIPTNPAAGLSGMMVAPEGGS